MFEQDSLKTGFAEINGGRMYYEVAGQGPTLVLAHAGIANLRMWDDQFAVFAQHYRVIRFDFWGFGQSPMTPNPYAYYQDLYRLLEFLGVERAHLVGSSLGGRVCLELALEYPQMVRSMVLVGSGLRGHQWAGEAVQQFSAAMQAAYERQAFDEMTELTIRLWVDGRGRTPDQVDQRVRERVREMLKSQAGGEVGELPVEPPAIGRLAEVTAPTFIIQGDRDDANIAVIADLLEAKIPGARRIMMPNTAHLPNMEQPASFNKIVLDFLQGISP